VSSVASVPAVRWWEVRLQSLGEIAVATVPGSPLTAAGVPPAQPVDSAIGGGGASTHARNKPCLDI